MPKRFLSLFILLLIALPVNAEEKKPYRVGVILPLSGPYAGLASYAHKAIELAYENFTPEQKALVEIVFQDDQFDNKQTVTGYNQLNSHPGGLDAVFTIASPPSLTLAPITNRNKDILIAIGASDAKIVDGEKYAFIHWVTPPVLGDVLAAELKQRDFKKIAFLSAEASGAIADMDACISALKELGHGDRVIHREIFPTTYTDFRTDLLKIKNKDADAIVVALFPGALSSFAKQARSVKLPAELIGMETFEDEGEVNAAEGALDGTWYVNASDPTDEFISMYKTKYNQHPGWAAGNAYDAVQLILAAVAAVGNDNDKVRDYLRNIKDFSGASGVFSSSGDQRFTLPAALKRVTKNGFEAYRP